MPVHRLTPAAIAIGSRVVVWLVALVALALFLPRRNPVVERAGWAEDAFTPDTLLSLVARSGDRWDARWYAHVAGGGYAETPSAAAFFPLYPLLMAIGEAVGLPLWLAGTLVSLVALAAAAVLLHQVVLRLPGCDASIASRTVLLWVFFPPAVALGAVYPESLLAALLAGAWLMALRDRRVACGICAGLAMLTKPLGVAALAFLLLVRRQDAPADEAGPWRSRQTWAGLFAAGVIAALWPLYLLVELGEPMAFANAQENWGRYTPLAGPLGGLWIGLREGLAGLWVSFTEPLALSRAAIANLGDPVGAGMQNAANLGAMLFMLVAAAFAWRWFGAGAGIATLVFALVPLTAPSGSVPLLSAPRFALVALPAFVVLARGIGRGWFADAMTVALAATFGMATAGFTLWQWVG